MIDDRGVFFTTAAFCLFAYVWMYIVLQVWTADKVTIPEAVITLIFFVVLVILAFMADKYNEYKKKKKKNDRVSKSIKEGVNQDEFYHIVGVGAAKARQSTSKKNIKDIPKPIEMKPKDSEQVILNTNETRTGEIMSSSNIDILDSQIRGRSKSNKVTKCFLKTIYEYLSNRYLIITHMYTFNLSLQCMYYLVNQCMFLE